MGVNSIAPIKNVENPGNILSNHSLNKKKNKGIKGVITAVQAGDSHPRWAHELACATCWHVLAGPACGETGTVGAAGACPPRPPPHLLATKPWPTLCAPALQPARPFWACWLPPSPPSVDDSPRGPAASKACRRQAAEQPPAPLAPSEQLLVPLSKAFPARLSGTTGSCGPPGSSVTPKAPG